MESQISGFKRKPAERPRSYAISSDNKRAKVEYIDEYSEKQKQEPTEHQTNTITHIQTDFESTVWEEKQESPDKYLSNIQFRLENMEYQLKTAKSHIELIKFHMKENYDLLHSELTYALDILGKMDRESQTVKIELLNAYDLIQKESKNKSKEE